MIIQIRGTSGSGKTTVVNRFRELSDDWEPVFQAKRKRPLYYRRGSTLALLGHYESPCGGCDTIGSARQVFDLIKKMEGRFENILCEGLLLSEDTKWSSQLEDLRVLFLTTDLETCLDRVRARRRAAGNDKPLSVDNTSKRVAVIERARIKLLNGGVECYRVSPEQATKRLCSWLGVGCYV